MGRIFPLVAVIVSFVAFAARVNGSDHGWVYAVDRGSYVLIVFAVVLALLTERKANGLVLGAQIAATAAALVFMAVALVRFYDSTTTAFGFAADKAYPWATEALVLATAALAFGLTLARRRSSATIVSLVVAIAVAFGSAIYAITQQASYTAEVWWWIAIAGAFLAAAFAAALEREGSVAPDAPEAGSEPESDPGVEPDSDPGVE
jgi:hypothetical protein